MKTLRQIGSIVFVIGLFTVVFAGIPWYVTTADDPVIPFEGDNKLQFAPASKTLSFWAKHNGSLQDYLETNLEDKVSSDSSNITMVKYTNCNGAAEVLFYRINGGGHTWPGEGKQPKFLGSVNRDIDASSEIWKFFSRHSLADE